MINLIVVHCAATPVDMDIGVEEIRQWHTNKGWSDVGYHYIIKRNGDVEKGRDETIQGAHVFGYNQNSLGICMVGGLDSKGKPEANFTRNQYFALEQALHRLVVKYPGAKVMGHYELDPGKACPCFNVDAFWNEGE